MEMSAIHMPDKRQLMFHLVQFLLCHPFTFSSFSSRISSLILGILDKNSKQSQFANFYS